MKRATIVLAVLLCPTLIIACITVNIYFPAAAIQQAAEEIVDEVRQEQQEEQDSSLDFKRAPWLAHLIPLLAPRVAFAQVDINISTPAIRALRASLVERFKSLEQYYRLGALGESNRGYLIIRDESGLNLQQKAELRRLVEAENQNRKDLYTEILSANGLDSQFLDEVERLFANSWRQKDLVAGTWVQKDDGTWLQK